MAAVRDPARRGCAQRLGWLVLFWSVGVATMGALVALLRMLMRFVGMVA